MAGRYTKPLMNQQAFYNGQSFDDKIGADSSLSYISGFDWRKNPSELVQAMQPRQISAGNLDDLIVNIIQAPTGERFGISVGGKFYLIDTSNEIFQIGEIGEPSGFGLTYHEPTDSIYITGQKSIHRFGAVKRSDRAIVRDFLARSVSSYSTGGFPAFRSGGSEVYNIPGTSALDETAKSARLPFQSDIDPLSAIELNFLDKGSGDITVVIHDPLNREVASVTVANADLPPAGKYMFVFPTPGEILVKPNAMTYHAHVYSTVNNASISCGSVGDFSTADFSIYADRMMSTQNGLHCCTQFLQYIVVGNGRYVSVWEPLSDNPDNVEYNRHGLTLPSGYQSCGVTATDEFTMVAFEKKAVIPSRQSNEGLLIFWDGLSGTYSQYIELKEGAPEALFTKDNIPHMIIGGTLYVYLGGKSITKIRDLPNTDNDFTGVKDDTVSYPYSMASFKKMLHMAYPSESSNKQIEYGVYNYGNVAAEYKPSFGYQYELSHEVRKNADNITLQTGCVAAFGDEMYITWKKVEDGNTTYGVDLVDSNCGVAKHFRARTRRFDARNVHKLKGSDRIMISTSAVPEGTTVYPFYRIDDGVDVPAENPMKPGATQAVLNIAGKKFHTIDYGVVGTSEDGVTTPLRVRAIGMEWDPLEEEDITDNGQQ